MVEIGWIHAAHNSTRAWMNFVIYEVKN